jgi:hypothetical protein
MEFIAEIFIEYIFVWIIGYPMAFIRWAFTGFKKNKLKDYLAADTYISLIYFAVIGIIFFLIYFLIKKIVQ